MRVRIYPWKYLLGKILAGFFLVMAYCPIQAQNVAFSTLDSSTAALFEKKSWHELIKIGNQGLKAGINYKNLRYRMGIAAFETGLYHASNMHFRAALKFDNSDLSLREYLSWSLIYSDEPELGCYYSPEKRNSTQLFQKLIGAIYSEAGIKASSMPDSAGRLAYGHIMLAHQLNKRLFINQGFTFIQQKYQALPYKQPQYYLAITYALTGSILLRPAVHLASVNGELDYINSINGKKVRHHFEIDRHITMSSFELNIRFQRLNFDPGFTYGKSSGQTLHRESEPGQGQGSQGNVINEIISNTNIDMKQYGLNVSYFPFIHQQNIKVSYGIFRHQHGDELAWLQQAGLKWISKYHHEINLKWMISDLPFTMEENGRFLSNSQAVVKQRIRLVAKIPLRPKTALHLVGAHEHMQEKTFTFDYYSFFVGIEFIL